MNELNLNIHIPNMDQNKITEFKVDLERINSKYKGQPFSNEIVTKIATDLEEISSKYGAIIKSDEWYNEELWTLNQLLSTYKNEYPDRYENKEEYTKIEINNILFDLQIAGVILGYKKITYPNSSSNKEIFHRGVTVFIPIINIKPTEE